MKNLLKSPQLNSIQKSLSHLIHNSPFEAVICIDDYSQKIATYFNEFIKQDLRMSCLKADIPSAFAFRQFGLVITFSSPTTLEIHDQDMHLNDAIKALVQTYGVVFFRNAQLTTAIAQMGHKNNFAHLNFHTDRGTGHANKYSLYTRDPRDPDQQEPRKASTLFVDNAVAYLQAMKEGQLKDGECGRRRKYEIFEDIDIRELFGEIILEQAWSAPTGTGEVGIIDNSTVLHSSYKHGFDPGYRIGARYLF